MIYAVINSDNIVVNSILLDNENDFQVEEGMLLVESEAPIGDTYDPVTGEFTKPTEVPEPVAPVRVTKADFQRLLTPMERYGLNALRKTIAALEPADYANPSNMLLVAAEDVMFAFEQPAEFIELNHLETYQGLMLLSYLGILTEARVNEIVASVNV